MRAHRRHKIRLPVYTIGHSTRSIDELVELLRCGEVELVVDVRTVRRSRTNPQYNEDVLPLALGERQIGYDHIDELGGLRRRSKDVPPEVNAFWQNQSFHNYADYALSPSFTSGLDQLERVAAKQRTAIMCAEAVWWRCHRRIIADYLILAGDDVFHLMDKDGVQPARITPAARARGGHLVYPAE